MDPGLTVKQQAGRHFNNFDSECCSPPTCITTELRDVSYSFRAMDRVSRVNAVRYMLLAVPALPYTHNDLLKTRKRKREEENSCIINRSVYSVLGQRLCKICFAAVTQLHHSTISYHARAIYVPGMLEPYNKASEKRCKDILSKRTKVAVAFFDNFASENGMECPTGRGSLQQRPLIWLPSSLSKTSVYKEYVQRHPRLMACFVERSRPSSSDEHMIEQQPLSHIAICLIWRNRAAYIKLMRPGSDYCDKCIELNGILESFQDELVKRDFEATLAREKCS